MCQGGFYLIDGLGLNLIGEGTDSSWLEANRLICGMGGWAESGDG